MIENKIPYSIGAYMFIFDKVNSCIHVEHIPSNEYLDCIEVGFEIDRDELKIRANEWHRENGKE